MSVAAFNKQILREKIIIYLDLTSKYLSRKELVKSLTSFTKSKLKNNPHQVFSVFFFNKEGEPEIFENIEDPKEMKKKLDEATKKRSMDVNNFENGLFFCLSGIASSFLEQAITFRVLVVSDKASAKNSEYMDALMNLVETVRTFPTFIDIIRIGDQRIYSDDVKLRVISTITSGGLFYVTNEEELNESLRGLVKNKVLPDLRPEGGQAIDPQHQAYYQDLAMDLEIPKIHQLQNLSCTLCNGKICQYCNDIKDSLGTCPSCGAGLHECCAALYSWTYNIGIKNIFRCPKCNTILKLDERRVYEINGESLPGEFEEDIPLDAEDETWNPEIEEESAQTVQEPTMNETESSSTDIEIISQEKANPTSTEEESDMEQKVQKVGGFFGPKITIKKRNVTSGEEEEEKTEITPPAPTVPEKKVETPDPQEVRARLAARRNKKRTSGPKIIVCPVCSSYIKPGVKTCEKCGCPIR